MAMASLIKALGRNLEDTRDSERGRRHFRRRTSNAGERVGGFVPSVPTPTPGTRPRVLRAIFLPYVNTTTQVNLYTPHLKSSSDQVLYHMGKGATPTNAQYTTLLNAPALHRGIEFFQLADISANAATIKAKGLDFISYDMEGGANGTPAAEMADPVGSMQSAKNICTANGLLLQGAAARATSDASAINFSQYCDLFHYQIQGYQEVPSTSPPPNYYQETTDMVTKVRTHNATSPITVQVSTGRAAEAGLTMVDTFIKRWNEVQPLDVAGISTWFSNDATSLGFLNDFVVWFDTNWH